MAIKIGDMLEVLEDQNPNSTVRFITDDDDASIYITTGHTVGYRFRHEDGRMCTASEKPTHTEDYEEVFIILLKHIGDGSLTVKGKDEQ